jgi:hypothetical protein
MAIISCFPQTAEGFGRGYIPPADWLTLDDCGEGNIQLLLNDTGPATYAFVCTASVGNYQIDWGDGTVLSYGSGVTAQHTYTVGSGKACIRGYTVFKAIISPLSGGLLSFKSLPHSLTLQAQTPGILGCVINSPTLTDLSDAFYATTSYCRFLEYAKILNGPKVVNTTNMFRMCQALKFIDLKNLPFLAEAGYMFYNCNSLQFMDISNLSALSIASRMFYGCSALQSINIGDLPLLTAADHMFNLCSALQSADISGLTAVTNAANMFYYNFSLKEIKADNFAESVEVVDLSDAFKDCEQLTFLSMPKAKVNRLSIYGSAAAKPNKLAALVFNSASSFGSSTSPQLELKYNNLSAGALNDIFTLLPVVSGKTVNITGCTGAAACDRSIATVKGWSVNG